MGSSCISCVRLQDNPCSTFPSGFYCNVQASNCRVVKKVLCRWGLYDRIEQWVLVVALCLLACWPKYSHFSCCIESFSLIPSSPYPIVVILVSMGLVSVPLIVPLGVADCRVAMDTSLYPDDHFPHHQPWSTNSQANLLSRVLVKMPVACVFWHPWITWCTDYLWP